MKYDPSTLSVLDFLMGNLIVSNNGSMFAMKSGELLNLADTAFLLYSVLSKLLVDFLEEGTRQFRGINIERLYSETMRILEEVSPSTRHLISAFGVQNFAFLNSWLRTFFTQDLPKEDDAAVMFTAIISAPEPAQFFACLVAASLIHLHERLQETPECDPDQFTTRYMALLPNLDVRRWLCNAEKLAGTQSPG
jgi:hypothetical protein